jgi:hypothetical protein
VAEDGDDIPGFGVDRILRGTATTADIAGILAYLHFEPEHIRPAIPVFILAMIAGLAAAVTLARLIVFAVSFDASDFPPGYLYKQMAKASALFFVAAGIGVVAGISIK